MGAPRGGAPSLRRQFVRGRFSAGGCSFILLGQHGVIMSVDAQNPSPNPSPKRGGEKSKLPLPLRGGVGEGFIEGTDKVYVATWAALLAMQAHNRAADQKIAVVGLPAMGTGFGGVPFDEAARQTTSR